LVNNGRISLLSFSYFSLRALSLSFQRVDFDIIPFSIYN